MDICLYSISLTWKWTYHQVTPSIFFVVPLLIMSVNLIAIRVSRRIDIIGFLAAVNNFSVRTLLHLWLSVMGKWMSFIDHCYDVIMGAMASQITNLTIVYSTVYSGAGQRKHRGSASLAFVRGSHRWPVNSPHKWPVTRKMIPFDDVIMILTFCAWIISNNAMSVLLSIAIYWKFTSIIIIL